MSADLFSKAKAAILAAPVAALCLWSVAETGAAPTLGCASFASQAAAQAYFVDRDGGPGDPVGRLDPDRDGVACEERPGPYGGFATIGYSKSKHFFYGTATMPPGGNDGSGFACLYGNPHFTDGPRVLTVYRVRPGADLAVTGEVGAEARPANGRLVWKAKTGKLRPGVYYAAFAERQRLAPYGPNECPSFLSSEKRLPRLRKAP